MNLPDLEWFKEIDACYVKRPTALRNRDSCSISARPRACANSPGPIRCQSILLFVGLTEGPDAEADADLNGRGVRNRQDATRHQKETPAEPREGAPPASHPRQPLSTPLAFLLASWRSGGSPRSTRVRPGCSVGDAGSISLEPRAQ